MRLNFYRFYAIIAIMIRLMDKITIYANSDYDVLPHEIIRTPFEDCGELQFCVDLIYWPRFDISWSYRAIFSFVIFLGIMLYA